MTAHVAARSIHVAYGANAVLRGVDLDLHPATVTVLLGANGAGKSTLMRVLAAEMLADRGVVKSAGHACGTSGYRRAIAYIAQNPPLADFLTTTEHAQTMAALRERDVDTVLAEVRANAEHLGLSSHLDRPVFALSGGMRQKAALCLALASGATSILLDEPYAGLDIRSARALRELVAERRDSGQSFLIASHLAEAVLAIADRAVLLNGGRISMDLDSAALAEFGGDPRAFEQAILDAM